MSGLTPSDILRANPDLQATPLRTGDCIALPHARTVPVMHVVQRGQSLWTVAQEYEVGLGRLLRANPDICDVEHLPEGSVVHIPGNSQAAFVAGVECSEGWAARGSSAVAAVK